MTINWDEGVGHDHLEILIPLWIRMIQFVPNSEYKNY